MNTTKVGQAAEAAVTDKLVSAGYHIIARNARTRFYEIDIIAVKAGRVHFVEVKYRRASYAGDGVAAITPAKLSKLARAAQAWLGENNQYDGFDLSLDVASVSGDTDDYKIDYLSNVTA